MNSLSIDILLTCLDEERTRQKSPKLSDDEWCDFCMGDFDIKTRPAKTHEFVKYLSTRMLVAYFMKNECQNTPSKIFWLSCVSKS